MNNGANNFTTERIEALRKNIDLSDIPEVKDFSHGHLRNPLKDQISFTILLDSEVYRKFKETGLDLETFIKSSVSAVANATPA